MAYDEASYVIDELEARIAELENSLDIWALQYDETNVLRTLVSSSKSAPSNTAGLSLGSFIANADGDVRIYADGYVSNTSITSDIYINDTKRISFDSTASATKYYTLTVTKGTTYSIVLKKSMASSTYNAYCTALTIRGKAVKKDIAGTLINITT